MQTFLKLSIAPLIGLILVLLPVVLIFRVFSAPDILVTEAPGIAAFEITESGKYTIWRKVAGVTSQDEFRVQEKELPAGMSLHIRHADSGATVPIETALGASQTSNAQSKTSLVSAELQPGQYELVSTTAGETIGLTISKDKFSFKGFLMAVASGVVGSLILLGGCIYAFIVLLKKSPGKSAGPTDPIAP